MMKQIADVLADCHAGYKMTLYIFLSGETC